MATPPGGDGAAVVQAAFEAAAAAAAAATAAGAPPPDGLGDPRAHLQQQQRQQQHQPPPFHHNGQGQGQGQGGGGGGGGGQAPPPLQQQQPLGQLPGGPYFVKVSQTSQVKQVAGKVAHTCREGDAPAMLTIGPGCINQAAKAIAIARGYLAHDGLDLTFQTAFREGAQDPSKPSVALYLAKHPLGFATTPNPLEMQVSAASQPTVVAGALAARVREGSVPALSAIGVDAVANCVLAVGHARLYLEQDGRDVRARPEFVHVTRGSGEVVNALRFHIHVDAIGGGGGGGGGGGAGGAGAGAGAVVGGGGGAAGAGEAPPPAQQQPPPPQAGGGDGPAA
jgi:stage V sporulation protein SpoVS